MKYFFVLFLLSIPCEARPPITAKNANQIAAAINKMKRKDVYSAIMGESQLGGFYTIFDGPCSEISFLKKDGYSLLDLCDGTACAMPAHAHDGHYSCSVSW